MDELVAQPAECVVVREWVDGYARHGAECSCGVYVSSVKLRESVLGQLGDVHPTFRAEWLAA